MALAPEVAGARQKRDQVGGVNGSPFLNANTDAKQFTHKLHTKESTE